MVRKILIVEDNEMNRKLLRHMLSKDYEVLEAIDGFSALTILEQEYESVSAVILDLVMPGMDGLSVLSNMQDNERLRQIPVIVATGADDKKTEEEALKKGAIDYITKPYIPSILKNRLYNTIHMREQAAIVNATRRDALTGLLSRAAFFEHAKELVSSSEPNSYVMACFNINNFKVINDQYGNQKGDDILKQIGKIFLGEFQKAGGIAARIMADYFAALYPRSYGDSKEIVETRSKLSILDGSIMPLTFYIGRYYIEDTQLEPSAMYDRAVIAMESIKGRYDAHVAVYDEKMRSKIVSEQQIISEMKQALAEGQFEVWYQPQINHATRALIGAEALVRWRHPQRGLISPGVFIPIFEKNGFVYEVDKYVWEQACIFLREMLDRKEQLVPISVNLSRYDIFREDCVDFIDGLIKKYDLPVEALRLEITESAFSKSGNQIIEVFNEFKKRGFIMEIDDFGSGYSSLNTLKDVPADILKMDMRFLEGETNSDRGGNIVESIVRMARWIGMSVIAEGVEEKEQADFLNTIGCNYIQGYYYSKPLPKADYESKFLKPGRAEEMITIETVENYDNKSFWNPDAMDTLIFNSYVGAACILEYQEGKLEIIRANNEYIETLCGEGKKGLNALQIDWEKHLTEECQISSRTAMREAIATGNEVNDTLVLYGYKGPNVYTYLDANIRVIAKTGNRYLFYCVLEDVTKAKEAEQNEKRLQHQLGIILKNLYSGVSARLINPYEDLSMIYANDQFYKQRGYTEKQYKNEVHEILSCVHPGDVDMAREAGQVAMQKKEPFEICYRIIRRDGAIRMMRTKVTMINMDEYAYPVQISVTDDITEEQAAIQKERETDELLHAVLENVGNGIVATCINAEKVDFLFTNNRYYEQIGYTREQYMKEVKDSYSIIHPDDRDRVFIAIHKIPENGEPVSMEYKVICRDAAQKRMRMVTVNRKFTEDGPSIQLSVFEDITKDREEEEKREELLDNLPCGAGIFDISKGIMKGIYLNKRYWQMVGRSAPKQTLFPVFDVVKLEDRAYLSIIIQRIIVSGKEQECEIHIQHGNGTYIPVLVRGKIVLHRSGRKTMYVTYTPITEETITYRKMLPVALKTMMESSTDFTFVKDRALKYVCASNAFMEMAGVENEQDLIGKNDYDLFEKSLADSYHEDDLKLLNECRAITDYIEELPEKDGKRRFSCSSKYQLCDSSGNVVGVYGVGRDVTENKEAFARLQVLTDTIPGGLATYEISLSSVKALYLSDGVYGIAGYSKDEYDLKKDDPFRFILEPDRNQMQNQVERLLQDGTPINGIYRVVKKDGECRWISIRGKESGRVGNRVTVNMVMLDVTEEKAASIKLNVLERENWNRYEHELILRKGLIKDSIIYYQLNLTTGVFEEFDSKYHDIPKMKKGVKTDDFIRQAILSKVLPKDAEKVRKTIFCDALREVFNRGDRSISLSYRRLFPDEGYHWVRTEVFMMQKPDNNNVIAFLHCREIDKEQKTQLAVETILDEDIETVIYIDVKRGVATLAHIIAGINQYKIHTEFPFTSLFAQYREEVVVKEDQDIFKEYFDISYLEERLAKENAITITYRVNENGELHRKQSKAYFLDDLRDIIVLTRRDITELYQEEQKQKKVLREAVEKANRASQAKSEFLSRMSHDIRTPLNAVLAFSNPELLDGSDDEKLKEYLQKINISGKYLLGIINDVLDMSRIEQSRMVLNPEPYELRDFQETVHNVIDESSKKRKITFIMDTSKTGKQAIIVDRVRFNQIFINLLSNAVKFTKKNGTVELIVEEGKLIDEKTINMHFIVRDNGIGMSKEFVPHAFDSFNQEYRKDSSERDQGTGLGLTIVKELVKMMNGTILLESELNVGTTFTIDLPVEVLDETGGRKIEKPIDYEKLKGLHVLLAEDNKINVQIARALLEKHGCIVDSAVNGEDAYFKFKKSESGYYQIILMDIRMPIMDGLTATKKIRGMRREDAKNIPIISMTADAFNEDEKVAIQAGMNGYVAKPIIPRKLYETCIKLTESKQ